MESESLNRIISGQSKLISLKDNQKYIGKELSDGNVVFIDEFKNRQLLLKFSKKRDRNHAIYNSVKNAADLLADKKKYLPLVLFNAGEYEQNGDQFYYKLDGNSWKNFSLSTGNLIGHLKIDNQEISIGSRFGNSFLKYIISDADGFIPLDDFGGIDLNDSIAWLIEYLWVTKLRKASRLGIPKSYKKQTSISTKVKGIIDVEHYELHKDLAIYRSTYRNHSYATDANLLILEVFRHLNKDFVTSEVNSLNRAFQAASEGRKMVREDLMKVKDYTNPYYSDYNDLLYLSKILLNNKSLDFGSSSNTSGFLFDVSMLFEYFIRKTFLRSGFQISTKNKNDFKIPTGISRNRNLYPDLIASKDGVTFLFDVKYKRFNKREGVNREDLFQIYTYLGQVSNHQKINAFGFIYPTDDKDARIITTEHVMIMGKVYTFLVCLLYVPEDGADFRFNFDSSVDTFMNELLNND